MLNFLDLGLITPAMHYSHLFGIAVAGCQRVRQVKNSIPI